MLRAAAILAVSLACALARAGDFFYAFEFPATPNKITAAAVSALEGKIDAESMFNLGVCRYLGAGTPADKESATVLFAAASALKSRRGAYAYAVAMLEGGARGDIETAVKILTALDKRGFAPATRALAGCYAEGLGVGKSAEAGRAMLENAFAFGSERAAVELALLFAGGKIKTGAPRGLFEKLKDLAGRGNVEASYALARAHQNGVFGGADVFEANRLLLYCADLGYAPAQHRLGMNYIEGAGVVADLAKGAGLVKLAAEKAYPQAMNNYAVCLQNGIGVEKNIPLALDFYRKAAAAGYGVAQNNLAMCYLRGFGGTPAEAADWLLKAARGGSKDAWENLAKCYLDGVGVDKNPAEAAYWLKQAADAGSLAAKGILGRMYVDGVDVPQNLKDGVAFLQEAAFAGDAEAMLHLGACYYTGTGVPKDGERARALFRKSAELGNKKARETLRKIER